MQFKAVFTHILLTQNYAEHRKKAMQNLLRGRTHNMWKTKTGDIYMLSNIPYTGASCNYCNVNSHDKMPPYKLETTCVIHLLTETVIAKAKFYSPDVYSRTNKEMNDIRSGEGFH